MGQIVDRTKNKYSDVFTHYLFDGIKYCPCFIKNNNCLFSFNGAYYTYDTPTGKTLYPKHMIESDLFKLMMDIK